MDRSIDFYKMWERFFAEKKPEFQGCCKIDNGLPPQDPYNYKNQSIDFYHIIDRLTMRHERHGNYYYCRHCDYFARKSNTLSMHITLKHNDHKRHKCLPCQVSSPFECSSIKPWMNNAQVGQLQNFMFAVFFSSILQSSVCSNQSD